ncbi:MAG TPA: hypothetical protein VF988_12385 [Verrucomicrobiae bacterium]
MDFLKKHYEKLLLGVMLAGLIGVLVFMLFYIASDKASMAAKRDSLTNPHVKPLANLDMTAEDNAMARVKARYDLDLETTNKLLNPMEWQKAMDGSLIPKATKTGLQMAVVTNITPLYLVVTFDSVVTNELGATYIIKVERQAAPVAAKRRAMPHYAAVGDKPNDAFQLLEAKGPKENPDGLVLKLMDTGDVVTISKDKPYRRVDGYVASFTYPPEGKVFKAKRVGDKALLGGVDYAVVEVSQDEVTLEDQSNHKKTSLRFVP